jgi:hypothetical protein
MAKRIPKTPPESMGWLPVWIDAQGLSMKIPAWKSQKTGCLYTWNSYEVIDSRFILRCWPQESEIRDTKAHEFTDADKIRAHSWGVAL